MPATDPDGGAAAAAPSPTMALLLEAAVAEGDRARAAWTEWLGAVDFEDLEDGATALLSLVRGNVADRPAGSSVEARVRGVHRQTWARNRVLWAAGAPLLDRLGAGATLPLLLPTAALVPLYDDDWGARPLDRIHVALPPDAVDEVRDALGDTGWAVDHLTPTLRARTRAGFVERWESQDPAGNWVAVRWHVLRHVRSAVADEQLRGAASVATVGSSKVLLLHPADALIERSWSSAGERSPGWIADVVRLARTLGSDGERSDDVARVAERARRLGLVPALRRRLAVVAATVADPAVADVGEALDAAAPTAASLLWSLPEPMARRGRVWAGYAAGQGVVGGARSLAQARWAARQLRSRGSAQRR